MIKPFIAFFVLIFSLVFGLFYAKPEYDYVQRVNADIQALDKTIKSTEDIKRIISQTGDSLDSIDAEGLARFDSFLPKTIDSIRLANNIQHIGSSMGIVVSDIVVKESEKAEVAASADTTQMAGAPVAADRATMAAPMAAPGMEGVSGTPTPKPYVATSASFSFTTTYTGFQNLLDKIEKSLGIMNITSLSFAEDTSSTTSGSKKTSTEPVYKFAVEFETYSLQ